MNYMIHIHITFTMNINADVLYYVNSVHVLRDELFVMSLELMA